MNRIRLLWNNLNNAIDKLDWEQGERLRQTIFLRNQDAMAVKDHVDETVAKALQEAHCHDRCQVIEAKLRSDLELLVQEMNDTAVRNAHLKEEITILRREKNIEESLYRAAIEEMARRKKRNDLDVAPKCINTATTSNHRVKGNCQCPLLDQSLPEIVRAWKKKANGNVLVTDQDVINALQEALGSVLHHHSELPKNSKHGYDTVIGKKLHTIPPSADQHSHLPSHPTNFVSQQKFLSKQNKDRPHPPFPQTRGNTNAKPLDISSHKGFSQSLLS